MLRKFILSMGLLAAVPATASAATYVTTDYGNGVFTYGSGTAGSSFTAYTGSFTNCFDQAGLSCQTSSGASGLPGAFFNTTGSSINFSTVSLPTGGTLIHPGPASSGQDSIVVFTAPAAGNYSYSGSFVRLDTTNDGNGVIASVFNGGTSLFSSTISNTTTYGSGATFGGTTFLNAGGTLEFAVGNNGQYEYDSTGLSATISAVPEPATWAMLLLGFGMIGFAMRKRSNVRTTISYA